MAFGRTKSRMVIPIVEMTPMIDIIFLLIIFFMVAAQFAQQARVDMNLPKEMGGQEKHLQENTFIINILQDGSIVVDSTKGAISLETLEALLEEKIAKGELSWHTLLIRADEQGKTELLNQVLVLLNRFNFSATKIATETH
jgi:biopolymer transport protein ExbD